MRDPADWSYQNPVPFDVIVANGVPEVFAYGSQDNQATVDYLCRWEDRYTVVRHLLGTGVYGSSATVHPTRSDLFARRAVISGIKAEGFDGSWVEYAYAKLNVTYQLNPGGQIGNGNTTAYITVDSTSAGDYMTLPGRSLLWAAGTPKAGKALSEPQQIYVPKKHHKVTVHQWFLPPFAAMDVKRGGINSDSINWVGRTIPAERLLFEDYHESFDVTFEGVLSYKVELSFIEKSRSWNWFPDDDGTFHLVTPTPFTQTTLADIFP